MTLFYNIAYFQGYCDQQLEKEYNESRTSYIYRNLRPIGILLGAWGMFITGPGFTKDIGDLYIYPMFRQWD